METDLYETKNNIKDYYINIWYLNIHDFIDFV